MDPSRYYHLNAFAAAPLSFLLRFAARGAVYLRRCIDGQAANDCFCFSITFTFVALFRVAPTLSRGSGAGVGLSVSTFPPFLFLFGLASLGKRSGN